MESSKLKELDEYYNNILALGETSFIYEDFEISKTKDGKWLLVKHIDNKSNNSPTIEIPNFIKIIGKDAFHGYDKFFRTLVIPEGVVKIEMSAFRDCNLRVVSLPETLEEIEGWAFAYCNLNELFIPDNVKEIGKRAFFTNYNLRKISLPSGIRLGEEVFSHCGNSYTESYLGFDVRKNPSNSEEQPYINCTPHDFSHSAFREKARKCMLKLRRN